MLANIEIKSATVVMTVVRGANLLFIEFILVMSPANHVHRPRVCVRALHVSCRETDAMYWQISPRCLTDHFFERATVEGLHGAVALLRGACQLVSHRLTVEIIEPCGSSERRRQSSSQSG